MHLDEQFNGKPKSYWFAGSIFDSIDQCREALQRQGRDLDTELLRQGGARIATKISQLLDSERAAGNPAAGEVRIEVNLERDGKRYALAIGGTA